MATTQTKNRGKFLTAMLVFGAYGILSSLITLFNTGAMTQAYGTLPGWFYPYVIVGLALGIVIFIGIWMWKKWAVYAIAASTLIGLIMNLFVFKAVVPGANMIAVILTLVGAGLWAWAISRKWSYFE